MKAPYKGQDMVVGLTSCWADNLKWCIQVCRASLCHWWRNKVHGYEWISRTVPWVMASHSVTHMNLACTGSPKKKKSWFLTIILMCMLVANSIWLEKDVANNYDWVLFLPLGSPLQLKYQCILYLFRCTINPGENEAVVRYALDTYSCLSLIDQVWWHLSNLFLCGLCSIGGCHIYMSKYTDI